MNTNSLKNTYYNTKSWVFAISATLAVHFILLAMFIPKKHTPVELNTSQQHPQIMMLPLNLKDSNSRINELIAWMSNENPMLIINPTNKFEYASIVKQDSSLPAPKNISDYKSQMLEQIIFLSSMKVSEIPITYDTMKDFFDALAAYPFIFSPIKTAISKDKGISYPLVEDLYKGYVLPVIFFNLGEKNSLIKKYNPSSPTVLKMNYPEEKSLLPSGTVIESCGIDELDKIGLNTITTQNFPDYTKTKLAGKSIFLKIDWQAPYAKVSK